MIIDRLTKFTPDLTLHARLGVLIPLVNGLLSDRRLSADIKQEIEVAITHMVRAAIKAKEQDQ